jgi:histidine ammonia-lyase
MTTASLIVGERTITSADVVAVARTHVRVELHACAIRRINQARDVVLRALDSGDAVYGLTTGLGERVSQRLPASVLGRYSLDTLRARANSIGVPLPVELVRATMFVRLVGLAAGYSGASIEAAHALCDWLNAGLHPRMPASGSIGASELCIMAHLGLALMGEGQVGAGESWQPVTDALAKSGVEPLVPAPKDGLALCGASSVAAGTAALALQDTYDAYELALDSCALAMEGFRANLSPLLPDVVVAHAAPGQAAASAKLRARLQDGVLMDLANARRVQDPLSFRCAGVNFGALEAALDFVGPIVAAEVNLSGDNPAVLVEREQMLSTGNFQTPLLGMAAQLLTQAIAQQAASAASRSAALMTGRLSGLPHILATEHGGSSGFAPLMKVADALLAEIRHLSQPVIFEARWTADGVEDELTNSHLAVKNLHDAARKWRLFIALELMVAAEAIERRDAMSEVTMPLSASMRTTLQRVRAHVAPLGVDRPLGAELEDLAATLLDW